MKILQIVHSLPFINQAGTEIYAYNLSQELSQEHQVYIFSRVCDVKQKDYEIIRKSYDGLRVYLINNTFRHCSSFEMLYENPDIDKRFSELLDEIKPDVAHIQHLVFLSTGLLKEIKNRNIPIVFTLHDYWLMCPKWHLLKKDGNPCSKAISGEFDQECPDCLTELLNIRKGATIIYYLSKRLLPVFMVNLFKKMYFSFTKYGSCNNGINRLRERNLKIKDLLKYTDIFLAPSEYLRGQFIKFGIHPEKIRLSRYGVDGSLFRNLQKKEDKKVRFAFMGTILPAKGLHVLINAFNGIRDDNAELKIYGKMHHYAGFEYYLSYLKKLIKNKNIKFVGEFNHQEVIDIFREVDMLVVPSMWQENNPFIILEAFLSKTPVIASRVGGIPEIVSDGINGLLTTPGDPRGLQEKIEYIINKPDIVNRFRENIGGVKSIKDVVREIEEIYSELVSER